MCVCLVLIPVVLPFLLLVSWTNCDQLSLIRLLWVFKARSLGVLCQNIFFQLFFLRSLLVSPIVFSCVPSGFLLLVVFCGFVYFSSQFNLVNLAF